MSQEERSMWEWMRIFQQLTEDDISPRAKWVSGDAYLHQCGDHPWVPLMGHSNMISYAPSLGMRQTAAIQYVPCTDGLAEVECKYTDPKAAEMIAQARSDWRILTYVQKKGRLYGKSKRYQAWHDRRYKALCIPEIAPVAEEVPLEAAENEMENPQVFEEEPSPLQQALERAARLEEECNRMRAKVQEAEMANAQRQEAEALLQGKLEKMDERRKYVLKKSEHLQASYENSTKEVERLKKRNMQWQGMLEEEQRQHKEEAKKRAFYQRETEEVKRQQEEYVAMSVEREAEMEQMIKEHKHQTRFYNEEKLAWRKDFCRIQKHRDECLDAIKEQKVKYQVACEDSRQFCRDLKREFQPMIDDVEQAYKGVSRALRTMGPDLRNPEVLRPQLEEARGHLAPYLFGRIAPRMLRKEGSSKGKGKQKIEEYDE